MNRPEAISLLGVPLSGHPFSGEVLCRLEQALETAREQYERKREDTDAIIAYGRALSGLCRFTEAIDVYSLGMVGHPDCASLYRHRGHRYISVRRYAEALADLFRAAALVDDDFDIWYHLALARWLLRDYSAAADDWLRCRECADDPDSQAAVSNWLFLSLSRSQRTAEAAEILDRPVPQATDEFHYSDLLRLYRGDHDEAAISELATEGPMAQATLLYGTGVWHLVSGRPERAEARFRETLTGPAWSAFGFIASETELASR